jgi:hypothetical protein
MNITDTKLAALQEAISSGRSSLASAMLEDESVRLQAEKDARDHLISIEEEEDSVSPWTWNLLFFLLGMLFAMSEPAIFYFIWDLIKIYGGGTL